MNIVGVFWWSGIILFCIVVFCLYGNALKKEKIRLQEELRRKQNYIDRKPIQPKQTQVSMLTEREKKIKETHDQLEELNFEKIKFERRVTLAKKISQEAKEKLELAYKEKATQMEIIRLKEKFDAAILQEEEEKSKLEQVEKEYIAKLHQYESVKK